MNSKAKGGSFERSVCKALSLWITDARRDDCLWRSAMSGGRATVQLKKGQKALAQCGDISAITPEGHRLTDKWVIECKHVRDLNLRGAISSGAGLLPVFWEKLDEEAVAHKRYPMLIAKQNNSAVLVFAIKEHFREVSDAGVRAELVLAPDWVSIFLFAEMVQGSFLG